MASMKVNGIILSENNLGDFDKMLTKYHVSPKEQEDLKVLFWQALKYFALENI